MGAGGCVKPQAQTMEVVPEPKARLDRIKPEAKEVRKGGGGG